MTQSTQPLVENRGLPLDVVRHVLWHFGDSVYGVEPGMFRQRLMLTVSSADKENRALLAKGFPEIVAAMNLAQWTEGGFEDLRSIAKAAL